MSNTRITEVGVRAIQSFLKSKGYDTTPTGIVDPNTLAQYACYAKETGHWQEFPENSDGVPEEIKRYVREDAEETEETVADSVDASPEADEAEETVADSVDASPEVEETEEADASPEVEETEEADASPEVEETEEADASPEVEETEEADASPEADDVDE
jgi:hypothetical protein